MYDIKKRPYFYFCSLGTFLNCLTFLILNTYILKVTFVLFLTEKDTSAMEPVSFVLQQLLKLRVYKILELTRKRILVFSPCFQNYDN